MFGGKIAIWSVPNNLFYNSAKELDIKWYGKLSFLLHLSVKIDYLLIHP
jgi:hypothetical protein